MRYAGSEISQDVFLEKIYRRAGFILSSLRLFVGYQFFMFVVGLGPIIPGTFERFIYRNSRWFGLGVWLFLFLIFRMVTYVGGVFKEKQRFDKDVFFILSTFSLLMFVNYLAFALTNPEYVRFGILERGHGSAQLVNLALIMSKTCLFWCTFIMVSHCFSFFFLQYTTEELYSFSIPWMGRVALILCGASATVLLSFIH